MVIIGFLLGGLIGIAVTLLLARFTCVKRPEYDALFKKLVETETKRQVLEERIKNMGDMAAVTQEQLKSQFEVLANDIFQKNSQQFSQYSQATLEKVLMPMKERFVDFNKKVEDSFGSQAKEQFALKQEIEKIVEANKQITLQAASLTKALKGDSRAQGNWGEILLEKILHDSGLRKDIDYITQGSGMGLAHTETGGHLKPDIIVLLPDNKHIIVDSKVSLTAYERYVGSEEDAERLVALKEFKLSLKNHIIGLESKRYQDSLKLGTPDFVLMFVPVEGAYALAIQQDTEIHSFAWDKRIVLVCPSTLFATLRTVASLWRLEQQNHNAQDIARKGADLYDKFVGFVMDMEKIGKKIHEAQASYDDAFSKLTTGRGNLVNRAESLRKLGIANSKSLPEHVVGEMEEMSE